MNLKDATVRFGSMNKVNAITEAAEDVRSRGGRLQKAAA